MGMKAAHDLFATFLDEPDRRALFTHRYRPGFSLLWTIALMISASLPSPTSGQAASSSKPSETAAGNAEVGKQLFKKYGCYECHGGQGQIASRSGPALAPDLIPFDSFAAYVREPKGSMPPYVGKVVSQKDLADIYAFLQTTPHPPAAKTIPILNAIAGEP
jgi:mono/diheme cytochrome c family protein